MDKSGRIEYIVVLHMALNEEQQDFTTWFTETLGLREEEELTVISATTIDDVLDGLLDGELEDVPY